jgi:hypothetical protein
MIIRVCLEKIDGHWQGACFPFRRGFQCGVIRVCWGVDQSLFVGMSTAGGGGLGNKAWGLQRLVWTGAVPFDIQTMRARADGFELRFTLPVDRGLAADVNRYRMESYTYKLEKRYGGPEADQQDLSIDSVVVSDDGRTVRLLVSPLRAGYVHELHIDGLATPDGTALLHPEAYYTLVKRPR